MNFKSENTEGLREYLEKYIERFKGDSEWEGYDYSFNHLSGVYKGLAGKEFTPLEARNFKLMYDPRKDVSVLNEVSRSSQTYRDAHVVDKVGDLLERGKTHIYFVYGNRHALAQRPALEYVMGSV